MASISILENTLLKLLVRRGTDADRLQITLESGELGYTTDTKRLFIGDGVTKGGILVGNKWKGAASNITALAPVLTGDYAFDSDDSILYICTANNGAAAGDWTAVASNSTAEDKTINISNTSSIRVAKISDGGGLSAGNITPSALGSSIALDGTQQVSLCSTINIDTITQRSTDATSYLDLPAKLKINKINYTFPVNSPSPDSFLASNAAGGLDWQQPGVVASGVAPTTGALIPVGTIVPYVSAAAHVPYGWLPCDGRSVGTADYPELSGIINYVYGGSGSTFKLPNLTNKTVYGNSDPQNSSLYRMTTGAEFAGLSATGTMFIIKAIGGVSSPTFTITKNISGSINGKSISGTDVQFNPLSGDIKIESIAPGLKVFNSAAGGQTFTFPSAVHYVKYYVTGAGAQGGNQSGGAAATCIGYLSAWPGAVFDIVVGAPGVVKGTAGGLSKISRSGNLIVQSNGGLVGGFKGDGSISTSNIHTLDGYVLSGAGGGVDTFNKNQEADGAASYWGGAGAPGAGGGSQWGEGIGLPTGGHNRVINGMVMFEWS